MRGAVVLVLWLCALFPALVYGQFSQTYLDSTGRSALGRSPSMGGTAHYNFVSLTKFVNSFTSYQFPNPFPPNQDPLSRLEFPIDQWFVGLGAGCRSRTFTLSVEAWTNLTRDSRLKMQDSDWDDEEEPFQKTIFSESSCRLNKGVLTNIRLGIRGVAAQLLSVQPVVGHRYQHFSFTTYDGFQGDLDGNWIELVGDGIDFEQTFHHVYFGGLLEGVTTAGRLLGYRAACTYLVQFDYAVVNARNEDLHLLRLGERITTQNTWGHCWHLSAGISFQAGNSLRASLGGDFKRIITHGDHTLTNPVFDIDFSFDGSKVWSDQASISAALEIAF